MKTYNKLVRDKIPDIIQSSGAIYDVSILSHSEYIIELKKKLQEEVSEFLQADHLKDKGEELADILEVVYALSEAHQISPQALEEMREVKARQRGRFADKLFLRNVEE